MSMKGSITCFSDCVFPKFSTAPGAPVDVTCTENDGKTEINWSEVDSLCNVTGYEISWTEHILWSDVTRGDVLSVAGTSYTSEHSVPYSEYTAEVKAVVNYVIKGNSSDQCHLQTAQQGKQKIN